MAEDQNRTLQDKFMLRLPDGMRDRLREAAEENKRSMNAEIVARLERSFPSFDNDTGYPPSELDTPEDRAFRAIAQAEVVLRDARKFLEGQYGERMLERLEEERAKPSPSKRMRIVPAED